MQTSEYQDFIALLRDPSVKSLWPKQKVDDVLVSTYWSALKDVPLATVRKCMDRHQQHGKWFPKPADLRPKVDKLPTVTTAQADGDFGVAEARCIRNLEELKRRDPERWTREVAQRRLDRLIATQHPGSSMYEAALNEWQPTRFYV